MWAWTGGRRVQQHKQAGVCELELLKLLLAQCRPATPHASSLARALARLGPPEAGDARPHSKVRLAAWGECAVLGRERGVGMWRWEGNRRLRLDRAVDKAVNRMGLSHNVFWPRR